MKFSQLAIFMSLSFALGIGVMSVLQSNKESSNKTAPKPSQNLSERKGVIGENNIPTSLNTKNSISSKPKTPKINQLETKIESDEPAGPEEAFAKLLNSPEARSLMKGFAGAMSRGADRMIAAEMESQKEKLGLSDVQVDSIKGKMVTMIEEETKKFQSELDDNNKSFGEIMQSQGEFWEKNEPRINALLKEELNDEQYAKYERNQLVEKTENIQKRANWELERMDSLDLSEEQEDQVFGILVQKSSQFDESMEIEGISSELPEAARSQDVSKEDAIRSILNTEQLDKYNDKIENGGYGRGGRGRGPWGRRGFGG
ncbi:MAG: hypothetical protein CMO38_02530 [Verrucomicrobiaceae bacterium]|nr:hypothetical protein [Verrucomicrobiaceae bacterium]